MLFITSSASDFAFGPHNVALALPHHGHMHILIHLAHDPRLKYFEQAQNQILSRLDNYLHVDSSDGAVYLGKKDEGSGIKLLFFKKKDRKDKEREIIKLLHKPESLAEGIYDRIGFR